MYDNLKIKSGADMPESKIKYDLHIANRSVALSPLFVALVICLLSQLHLSIQTWQV